MDFVSHHLTILKKILNGVTFKEIKDQFESEITQINYLEVAKENDLFSFDDEGNLIVAYPVSPIKTNFKVEIENIGSVFSIDKLVSACENIHNMNKLSTNPAGNFRCLAEERLVGVNFLKVLLPVQLMMKVFFSSL